MGRFSCPCYYKSCTSLISHKLILQISSSPISSYSFRLTSVCTEVETLMQLLIFGLQYYRVVLLSYHDPVKTSLFSCVSWTLLIPKVWFNFSERFATHTQHGLILLHTVLEHLIQTMALTVHSIQKLHYSIIYFIHSS